jgi:hypothetical protein
VRWRLKEGLDRLRDGLDRRYDGDRRRWMLLLAAVPVPAATATLAASLARGAGQARPDRRKASPWPGARRGGE